MKADAAQKTVVISSSAQEVEELFKVPQSRPGSRLASGPLSRCVLICVALQALSSISAFCLMLHESLSPDSDCVMEQWRKDIGPRTHIILGKPLRC